MILCCAFLHGEELCHSFSFFVNLWTGSKEGGRMQKELYDHQGRRRQRQGTGKKKRHTMIDLARYSDERTT